MRRIQQSVVCLFLLGASADASFGLAPRDRDPRQGSRVEAPPVPSFLATLKDLLTRAWGRTSCQIDPFGLCLPNQEPAATPSAGGSGSTHGDTSCQIDPAGGCAALR